VMSVQVMVAGDCTRPPQPISTSKGTRALPS
jgi:hypothetical protein